MMCPCHSGLSYETCCKPYHDGVVALTPLALMRSRYSGYALKKVGYIVETTHPDLLPYIGSREEILRFCTETSSSWQRGNPVLQGWEEALLL